MIDKSLRRLLMVLVVCFSVLLVQISRIQVLDAEDLRNNPENGRSILRDFNQRRGPILTIDGTIVADSTEVFDSAFTYQRQYPEAELYAHTAGYYSFNLGASGVEKTYNDWLSGRSAALRLSGLNSFLGGAGEPGTVVLSIDHRLQEAAQELLAGREGSVVLLQPSTGAVLAMYSENTFDPRLLANHDGAAAVAASAELNDAPGNPRRPAAFSDNFFPGSSFKVVTAAALLDGDVGAIDVPPSAEYFAPLASRPIGNSGGTLCGGSIDDMIASSCNTGFARLAAEFIGPEQMSDTAEGFGFNDPLPFDLAGSVAAVYPTDFGDRLRDPEGENLVGVYADSPVLAQSALGQNNVSASPLQMAVVAAAVANGGEAMSPHVVHEVRKADGSVVHTVESDVFSTATSPETALALQLAMRGAVLDGTARGLAIDGIDVGAKTGTAQLGEDEAGSHAWVIGFAGDPGFPPEIAFAVHVKANPEVPDQSGSRTAVPIARELVAQYFGLT